MLTTPTNMILVWSDESREMQLTGLDQHPPFYSNVWREKIPRLQQHTYAVAEAHCAFRGLKKNYIFIKNI